jgi:hypothetical protein
MEIINDKKYEEDKTINILKLFKNSSKQNNQLLITIKDFKADDIVLFLKDSKGVHFIFLIYRIGKFLIKTHLVIFYQMTM